MQTIVSLKSRLTSQLTETKHKLAEMTAAYEGLLAQGVPVAGAVKTEMRRAALLRRNAVDDETRSRLAGRLAAAGAELVAAFEQHHGPGVISLFSPIGSEPDVRSLAATLAEAGSALALPVDWSHGGPLVYRRWAPGHTLAAGPLGIAEPLPDAPSCDPDILIMPMVAYDRRGGRIGYGAGNVDRTLEQARAQRAVLVIGVAFSVQEELVVPTDEHDQPVDVIITERETILVNPAAVSGSAG